MVDTYIAIWYNAYRNWEIEKTIEVNRMNEFSSGELMALTKLINREERLRENNISLENIYEIQGKIKNMKIELKTKNEMYKSPTQ